MVPSKHCGERNARGNTVAVRLPRVVSHAGRKGYGTGVSVVSPVAGVNDSGPESTVGGLPFQETDADFCIQVQTVVDAARLCDEALRMYEANKFK